MTSTRFWASTGERPQPKSRSVFDSSAMLTTQTNSLRTHSDALQKSISSESMRHTAFSPIQQRERVTIRLVPHRPVLHPKTPVLHPTLRLNRLPLPSHQSLNHPAPPRSLPSALSSSHSRQDSRW